MNTSRPAQVCTALLAALEASEGRRRQRKRDQTPDAIGLAVKREILQRAVEADPGPEVFEKWLLEYSLRSDGARASAVFAMARAVYDEWCLAQSMDEFRSWLARGAPSDDVSARDSSSAQVPDPRGRPARND